MRPAEDVARVRELASYGLNHSQIARLTGVSRATVRDWLRPGSTRATTPTCAVCGHEQHDFSGLPERKYSYLLGMYLGDGIVVRVGRCLALRVFMDSRYPNIIEEVAEATRAVMPTSLASVYPHPRYYAVTIASYSKAWGCLFPQHGPGRKHERKIELAPWQEAIVDSEPEAFVRGLIHSDGCRVMNRVCVNGKDYAYPRYFFSQVSKDIQGLFCRTLEQLGVEYSFSTRGRDVSIARRESVARHDSFVGPKA
jgi:hypothetical protein